MRTRETFGKNLFRRLKKAEETEMKERTVLNEALSKTTHERIDQAGVRHVPRRVTEEYLEEQAQDQHEYYRNYQCVHTSTYRYSQVYVE
jgi:hypothetical protein